MSAPALEGRELLDAGFFARDAHVLAPELVGCALLREGVGGVVVEVEAYEEHEPACHAFAGRTARTEVLFGPAGCAYVYLSYGIHELFNVVTGSEGSGQAVLVRALEPRWDLPAMRRRRRVSNDRVLCGGPGRLSQALGISLADNRADLAAAPIQFLSRRSGDPPERLLCGPRIGITKATGLPWRHWRAGSPWLSSPSRPRA